MGSLCSTHGCGLLPPSSKSSFSRFPLSPSEEGLGVRSEHASAALLPPSPRPRALKLGPRFCPSLWALSICPLGSKPFCSSPRCKCQPPADPSVYTEAYTLYPKLSSYSPLRPNPLFALSGSPSPHRHPLLRTPPRSPSPGLSSALALATSVPALTSSLDDCHHFPAGLLSAACSALVCPPHCAVFLRCIPVPNRSGAFQTQALARMPSLFPGLRRVSRRRGDLWPKTP